MIEKFKDLKKNKYDKKIIDSLNINHILKNKPEENQNFINIEINNEKKINLIDNKSKLKNLNFLKCSKNNYLIPPKGINEKSNYFNRVLTMFDFFTNNNIKNYFYLLQSQQGAGRILPLLFPNCLVNNNLTNLNNLSNNIINPFLPNNNNAFIGIGGINKNQDILKNSINPFPLPQSNNNNNTFNSAVNIKPEISLSNLLNNNNINNTICTNNTIINTNVSSNNTNSSINTVNTTNTNISNITIADTNIGNKNTMKNDIISTNSNINSDNNNNISSINFTNNNNNPVSKKTCIKFLISKKEKKKIFFAYKKPKDKRFNSVGGNTFQARISINENYNISNTVILHDININKPLFTSINNNLNNSISFSNNSKLTLDNNTNNSNNNNTSLTKTNTNTNTNQKIKKSITTDLCKIQNPFEYQNAKIRDKVFCTMKRRRFIKNNKLVFKQFDPFEEEKKSKNSSNNENNDNSSTLSLEELLPKSLKPRGSKYRGVSRNGNLWQVLIMVNKKKRYVGGYLSEENAAKAYDKVALQFYGIKAKTNYNYSKEEVRTIINSPLLINVN